MTNLKASAVVALCALLGTASCAAVPPAIGAALPHLAAVSGWASAASCFNKGALETVRDVRDELRGPRACVPTVACLPDVPDAGAPLSWPVVDVEKTQARTAAGDLETVVFVTHQLGDRKVMVGWYRLEVIFYDAAPDDRGAAPFLSERAHTPDDATLKSDVAGDCVWRAANQTRT